MSGALTSDRAPAEARTRLKGRVYVGERSRAGWRVSALAGAKFVPLAARTSDALRSFSWGRSSASVRELAWSIIYDCSHDPQLADDWCSAFCADVITALPSDGFWIASRDVDEWLHGEGSTSPARHRAQPRALVVDAASDAL
jgi:hypothetical protein